MKQEIEKSWNGGYKLVVKADNSLDEFFYKLPAGVEIKNEFNCSTTMDEDKVCRAERTKKGDFIFILNSKEGSPEFEIVSDRAPSEDTCKGTHKVVLEESESSDPDEIEPKPAEDKEPEEKRAKERVERKKNKPGNLVLDIDFEKHKVGTPWDKKTIKAVDGFETDFVGNMRELSRIVSFEGGKCLRISYPKNITPKNHVKHRQAAVTIPESGRYFLEYDVLFEKGFGFNSGTHADKNQNGGKLPGLYRRGKNGDKKFCSGGQTCWVKGNADNGYGARYMWRKDGRLVLYPYYANKQGKWGADVDLDFKFTPGKWANLKQELQVNDPNKANGWIKVWVNGDLKLHKTGMMWSKNGLPMDHLYFSTFHGGGSTWRPGRDSWAKFDNFRVYK